MIYFIIFLLINIFLFFRIVTQKTDIKSSGCNLMHIISNKSGFLYLLKIPIDPLLHIYLFECESLPDIVNLLESIQNYVQMSFESVGIKIPKAIISKSTEGNGDDQSLNQILGRNGTQATPASNLKMSLSIKSRNGAQQDKPRISTSKSYTSGFNNSYKEVGLEIIYTISFIYTYTIQHFCYSVSC